MTRRIPWVAGALCALAALTLEISPATLDGEAAGVAAESGDRVTLVVAEAEARGKKRKNVARCVKYSQDIGESDMTLVLDNRCKQDLECTMTWNLQCHGDDGEVVTTERGETFDIAQGKGYSVVASTASCGDDGWSIEDVRWTCRDSAE